MTPLSNGESAMTRISTRRKFLKTAAGLGALAGNLGAWSRDREIMAQDATAAPEHTLTVIGGTPRERGRRYGRKFAQAIQGFLDGEIYHPAAKKTYPRDELFCYASQCG